MQTLKSKLTKGSLGFFAVFGLLFLFASPTLMTSGISTSISTPTTSCKTGCVYIALDNTSVPEVAVVKGTKYLTAITLPAGAEAFGALYIPTVKEIFVADYGLGEIHVISPSTNKIVKTIEDVPGAAFMAFDPKNGLVYVSEFGETAVAVINPKTDKITTTLTVCGEYPEFLAYNSVDGNIYVPSRIACYSIIDPSTNKVTNVSLGDEPTGVAVNPKNGYAYITDFGTNDTYVVKGSTLVATLTNASLDGRIWGAIYSPTTNEVYVVNTETSTAPFPIGVIVPISSSNQVGNPISVGQGPDYGCYVSTSKDVLVTNTHGGVPGNATLVSSSNIVVTTIALGTTSSGPYGCAES